MLLIKIINEDFTGRYNFLSNFCYFIIYDKYYNKIKVIHFVIYIHNIIYYIIK